MDHDPAPRGRRSLRLTCYDYTKAGPYFVTMVTQDRLCLFGAVADGEVRLNEAGRLVRTAWESLPGRFEGLALDAFVVMPNHIHGVIAIDRPVGAGGYALGDVIRAYKSLTTAEYAQHVRADGWPSFNDRLWQRNFYEHIVRRDEGMDRIRAYIRDNPLKWELDSENLARPEKGANGVGAPLVGARSQRRNVAPEDRPWATTRVAPTRRIASELPPPPVGAIHESPVPHRRQRLSNSTDLAHRP